MSEKMSGRPPAPKDVNDFINAAERLPLSRLNKDDLPWLKPGVREYQKKSITFRLLEPYILKLKYIGDHSPYTQQTFAREILQKAIDDYLENVLLK